MPKKWIVPADKENQAETVGPEFPGMPTTFLTRMESRSTARAKMAIHKLFDGKRFALLGCALLGMSAVGCQTTIGGQTLPSAYYLQDDVQYFPQGPEFRLSRQVEALEAYKLSQQGLATGDEAPAPAVPPTASPIQ